MGSVNWWGSAIALRAPSLSSWPSFYFEITRDHSKLQQQCKDSPGTVVICLDEMRALIGSTRHLVAAVPRLQPSGTPFLYVLCSLWGRCT